MAAATVARTAEREGERGAEGVGRMRGEEDATAVTAATMTTIR